MATIKMKGREDITVSNDQAKRIKKIWFDKSIEPKDKIDLDEYTSFLKNEIKGVYIDKPINYNDQEFNIRDPKVYSEILKFSNEFLIFKETCPDEINKPFAYMESKGIMTRGGTGASDTINKPELYRVTCEKFKALASVIKIEEQRIS